MIVLSLLACAKPPPDLPEGAACTAHRDCASGHCIDGHCSSGADGAKCTPGIVETGCNIGLECVHNTCMRPERVEAARKQGDVAKERELLSQSGVDGAPQAPAVERPPPPAAGPGARVRVVTTKSKGSAFAACRSDERLTGGSCTGWNLDHDGPTGFGTEDTIGARWSCHTVGAEAAVTAVALCARVTASP